MEAINLKELHLLKLKDQNTSHPASARELILPTKMEVG